MTKPQGASSLVKNPQSAVGAVGETLAGTDNARPDSPSNSPDHAAVDQLIAEATRIMRVDHERLKELAEQAFELACQPDSEGNQYRFGMASAVALLAHLSSVHGESDTAMQQASQALALLDSHEPSATLGNLYLTMGWAYYQMGDFVNAIDVLESAQHVAEQIDDRSLTAYVMDRIANVYHSTDRAMFALGMQERVLAIHRELGDRTGEAIVLNNMTYTYLDLNRYDEALKAALASLNWAEEEECTYLLMGVLDTLAEVYRRKGDLDIAAEYSARDHELARLHHSAPDRGDALFTMALIALERERYDEALEAATESLAIAEQHNRAVEEFNCHELLSTIQEKRGDIPGALSHCRRHHELERTRVNEETDRRLASLQVKHEVDTARKDAEIHRLRSLALEREVEQGRIMQTQLEAQASLDSLTGLFNRRHISALAQDLSRELAQGRQASVILFDLDHFKEINDSYGHFAGDCALVEIAKLLRDNARDSDTPVRYGGDEFMVLLSGTGPEKSGVIAERIRSAVATRPIVYRSVEIPLTISVGVASAHPGAPIELLELIERADRALYSAKRAGRNCIFTDPA